MRKSAFAVLVASVLAMPAVSAPPPDDILKSSLAFLAKTKRIQVRATVMNDELVGTGQKLQRTMDGLIKIRRPDGLRVDTVADRYRRTIQYDGKTLAIYDPEHQFYATFDAPPTIDATADVVRQKLDLDLPLAMLFAENASTTIGSAPHTATYVGLHRAGGKACHHLAFSQQNVDWQIWIAADGPPLPQKIVIDFKNRPARPEYIALLTDWNLDVNFEASVFQFTPPAGAQKIDFIQAEGASK